MKITNYLEIILKYLFFTNKTPEYDFETDNSKCLYKIKKIAFYNGCEDNRSDRYRIYNIAEALRRRKIRVDVYNARSIKYIDTKEEYDLLIIFREDRYLFLRWKKIAKRIKKLNIPMIYDTDDYTIERIRSRGCKNILKIINFTNAITVSTDYLAKKIKEKVNKPVYIIKNTINYEQIFFANKTIRERKSENIIKIVYQSGTSTHNEDFKVAEKPIYDVLKTHPNVKFYIFGPLELSEKFKTLYNQIVYYPYMDYLRLQVYISEMDINIAPLRLNEFNNCKSELKLFEAALLAIPTICSPIFSYKKLVQNSVDGLIAYTTSEWEKYLNRMIENKKNREEIGMRAQKNFLKKFYIDENIEDIIHIYENVYENNKLI